MSLEAEKYFVCRTCFGKGANMACIYNTKIFGHPKKIHEMIMLYASVQISKGDGLSDHMCLRCVAELNRAFLFSKKCEKTDTMQRDLLTASADKENNTFPSAINFEFVDLTNNNPSITADTMDKESNQVTLNESESHCETTQLAEKGEEKVNDDNNTTSNHNEMNAVQTKYVESVRCSTSFDTKSSTDSQISEENHQGDIKETKILHQLLHTCTVCKMTVSSRGSLKNHMRVHCEKKEIKCNFCAEVFTSRDCYLKHHTLNHSGGINMNICSICGNHFGTARGLIKHELTHKAMNSFLCSVCGKSFAGKKQLQAHSSTHSEDKPYKCDLCSKTFAHSGTLTVHRRMHTGEKPYNCNFCGKLFKSGGQLRVHRRVHSKTTPVECKVCNKLYSRYALSQHMLIHTAEWSHKCNECGRCFRVKKHLTSHYRIHTGERPYVCEICGRTFRHDSAFAMHKKLLHKPKKSEK